LNLVLSASDPGAVLVGAGDIAKCGTPGAEQTAKLLDSISGTVFVAGDNAPWMEARATIATATTRAGGRHRSRTRPVPGNHEYQTPNASGYFGYFGAIAGPPGLGYYSYTLGSWLVLAVNSEVPVGEGSAQLQWVRNQLATSPSRCTAVYWHRPLFSSGRNGPNPDMRDLWRVLYSNNVEIVLNGHEHLYERFGPQTPDGQPDPIKGIRQFTVGTGGAAPYPVSAAAANSEVTASVLGVASFTLRNDGYSWAFIPVEGETFRDSGTGVCH
jgi:acid phosphatase type 7